LPIIKQCIQQINLPVRLCIADPFAVTVNAGKGERSIFGEENKKVSDLLVFKCGWITRDQRVRGGDWRPVCGVVAAKKVMQK
jgi:hypothetical protein